MNLLLCMIALALPGDDKPAPSKIFVLEPGRPAAAKQLAEKVQDDQASKVSFAHSELYREKGYDLASVTLLEGGNQGDKKIVIEIFEGPKAKVTSIDFKGNQFASAATLRTHIDTRKTILGLFGKYHAELLEDDRQKLVDYYHANGFFEAKVATMIRSQDTPGEIGVTFVISEGIQYKVRNVIIEGNRRIKSEALRKDLDLLSGKPFMLALRDADKRRILIQYGEIGCIDAYVKCEPRFTDKLGVVDLLYSIEEHEPFSLGELEIVGNDRTKDKETQSPTLTFDKLGLTRCIFGASPMITVHRPMSPDDKVGMRYGDVMIEWMTMRHPTSPDLERQPR